MLPRYARAAPTGSVSSDEAARQLVAAVAAANAQAISRVLIDLRGLVVISRTSVMQRYDLGHDIARTGGPLMRIAVIMSRDAVIEHEFTFVVASNRGPRIAGFATQGEAQAWLLAA